ncbi:MAG: YdeI/OmpD-associated family protein [Bacteroidales bacterium]|nr:YdeI/OmpD-associated family protein [Bacteroidales bacterium]
MEIPAQSSYFVDQKAWRVWLEKNHDSVSEFWIIYYKKHTAKPSIYYREALEEALCFGWIDGRVNSIDDEKYIQRFTPRRPNGNWSEVNINLALKLREEGKMHASGLRFQDRWIPGEGSSVNRVLSESNITEWQQALQAFPVAAESFSKLPASHRKQYLQYVTEAKRPETRQKRMAESIALLEKGEKLGPK